MNDHTKTLDMLKNEYIPPRVNILGVGVSVVNPPLVLNVINYWLEQGSGNYICVRDVHGIMECQRSEELRIIHNRAGLVTPDGMPLVWLCHIYGYPHVERVYGPDLMLSVCKHSLDQGYRHFLYGGKAGVPELLAQRLKIRFPNLQIVGAYSPPFRPITEEEDSQIIEDIHQSKADIIWVGLSTPKQERWMADHVLCLNRSVLIGVGAAFDFHAGLKKQAPLWMQHNGLEWQFRLLLEPRRLWRRYLINNPCFLFLIMLQISHLAKFPFEKK